MKRNFFLNGNEYQLSETTDDNKLSWKRVMEAFTDESKALNFPIKYPAIDFDVNTKKTILITAGVIAGGLIIMGALIGRGKK